MKLLSSRKVAWGLFICGVLVAGVSFFVLPAMIPTHFTAGGVADDWGNKIEIFLFPILQGIVMFLSGREGIKYCLTHSKTFLTEIQYNRVIDGILIFVLAVEVWSIVQAL